MFLTHEIVITLTIKYVKKSSISASHLPAYRKLLGFMSNSSLKHLLKYEGEVKPTSYAISETLFSVFSNS